MDKPAPRSYSMDWTHRCGARICAELRIEPGNNDTPADILLMFEDFCGDMRDTLLLYIVNKEDDVTCRTRKP